MPSTIYKGDISEVTFGHETGIVLSNGAFGGLQFTVATVAGSDISTLTFSRTHGTSIATTADLVTSNATITVASTTGLYPGMILTKVSGDGALYVDPLSGDNTTIATVDSATQITAGSNHPTAGAIVFSATFSGDPFATWFVDSSANLKYPKGLLVGSKLNIRGGGNFGADDHTKGLDYTVIDNGGTTIKVTPAMKTTNATASTTGPLGSFVSLASANFPSNSSIGRL